MSIGSTNVSLNAIYGEAGNSNTPVKFYDNVNAYSWAQGPAPGDGSVSDWGWGVKTGVHLDILHGPYANGVTAGRSNNYRFSDFKNSYGYFDQANYVIDFYIENNIPPAGRGFPANDIAVDFCLRNEALTTNCIQSIAGNASENGGTFGPSDVSQPTTFNVEYLYIDGAINNQGPNPYNIDIYVNSTLELSFGGANGNQPIDYTMFNNTPQNSGGFIIEVYCA